LLQQQAQQKTAKPQARVLFIIGGMLSDAIFAVKLKSLQQLEELFDGQLCLAENIPQDGTR
jgi:hypothetical protein